MNILIPTLVLTIAIFVWFVRMTRSDKKKLKVVHRKEDHNPLFV